MKHQPKLLRRITGRHPEYEFEFFCVACQRVHRIRTRGFFKRINIADYPPEIKDEFKRDHFSEVNFNNNFNLPSIKDAIQNTNEKGYCHLMITRGRLIYLSDTTNGFRGQTFNMVEL